MYIISRAPLRLGLAGGGTDVSPYCDDFGGKVLNTTISLFARVVVRDNKKNNISIRLADMGVTRCYQDYPLPLTGQDILVAGVYNYLRERARRNQDRPCTITTWIDVPPGSGLGSSSTLVVALVGALSRWFGFSFTREEVASLAFHIERTVLGLAGGRQDQYAAAYGGFNFMEFGPGEKVNVMTLSLNPGLVNQLEARLVIANIGTSRVSSRIIEEQQKNVIKKEDDVLEAMARLKEYAEVMKNGLLAGCVDVVGEVLRDSWEAKKRLAHSITTSQIDIIVANLLSAGAMGVKISGAGGGGFLTVYVKEEQRHCVVQALNTMGIVPLPFGFIDRGMEVWECERQ